MKGNGDYRSVVTAVKSAVKSVIPKGAWSSVLGAAGGAGAGALFGPEATGLGLALGRQAGSLIARATGFGDYNVGKNSFMNKGNPPSFAGGDQSIRVRHREMVSTIGGSTTFNINTTYLNPGNATIFPWLHTVAKNYEQYELHGLFFEYEPLSGSIGSSNPSLGKVMMATQYDVLDPPFASSTELLAYMFSTSSVPCNASAHAVECARRVTQEPILKVRTSALPSGANPQLYDIGNFSIATDGQPSAYVIGQVWVVYDITFHKPKMTPCAGAEWAHKGAAFKAPWDGVNNLDRGLYDVSCTFPMCFVNQTVKTELVPQVAMGSYGGYSSPNRISFAKIGFYLVELLAWTDEPYNNFETTWSCNDVSCDIISEFPSMPNLYGATGTQAVSYTALVRCTSPGGYIGVTFPSQSGLPTKNYAWTAKATCLPFPITDKLKAAGSTQTSTYGSAYPLAIGA